MENIFSYENLQVDLSQSHHIVNLEYGGPRGKGTVICS